MTSKRGLIFEQGATSAKKLFVIHLPDFVEQNIKIWTYDTGLEYAHKFKLNWKTDFLADFESRQRRDV